MSSLYHQALSTLKLFYGENNSLSVINNPDLKLKYRTCSVVGVSIL